MEMYLFTFFSETLYKVLLTIAPLALYSISICQEFVVTELVLAGFLATCRKTMAWLLTVACKLKYPDNLFGGLLCCDC